MTVTKVTIVTVCLAQIPSRCLCLHQRMIVAKRTRGAIKSHEDSLLASWVELKLLYPIVTSSSYREKSRQHSPTSATAYFNEEDHPASTRGVGTIPLLCTPTINNIAVNRTLIDGGAGLNIISVEIFEKMQVPYHRFMPTRLFFRVTEGSTTPIGQVRLPITFSTRDNYRTESLDFDVAYIALPYNAILSYPALARFMAATHHGFNVLKISGANGAITVRCNEKDALRSVEHVYREAATMFPTDEDLLEHSSDLTRKKQLVSQERATAKKASLEPHLPGSTGKKFATSASPTPSEDLVHPMLDMSIGEAVVPSGRRPQFTQECSPTKKVPLQARGCEKIVTIGAGLSPK
jgi:hypothetical protein